MNEMHGGGRRPLAIDLFAGGGGLTVGLKQAGFEVSAAVELDRDAAATYKANHPEVRLFERDIRSVQGKDLLAEASERQIDLIAGCPPCQGFTSLTAKWRRDDPRNSLIDDMGRIVAELLPKAVMLENVPRLASKGGERLAAFEEGLIKLGYHVQRGSLQVADYGTPQQRKRFVLMAGRGFSIPLPLPTHAENGSRDLEPWRSVRDAIGNLLDPNLFVDKKAEMTSSLDSWHVVRKMSEANVKRLKWTKPGSDWRSIPEEFRPRCHRGAYFGFRNVYGRMSWSLPSPTITSGCTTFSKGRFGHPDSDRTISVKEAALLQEFPANYRIETRRIDEACKIVGNALPCGFAMKMAAQVKARLDEVESDVSDRGHR